MFLADKKSNLIVLEDLVFSLIVPIVLSDAIITMIAVVPIDFVVFLLSAIVLVSLCSIILEHMSGFSFLPTPIILTMFYLLLKLCVIFDPTYLSTPIKILSIFICFLSSIQTIIDIWNQKKWLYVYQFELIGKIKLHINIILLAMLFDIIDKAGYNFIYLFFIIPLIIMGTITYGFDRNGMLYNSFYVLYLIALLLICLYNHLVYGEFYRFISYMLLLLVYFLLYKQLNKRKTVLLLAGIYAYYVLAIYIRVFNFFSDRVNFLVEIVSLLLNVIVVAAIFLKIKQHSVRKLFSQFIGVYDNIVITNQINDFMNAKAMKNETYGDAVIRSAVYAKKFFDIDINIRTIRKKAEQSDNILAVTYYKRLSFVLSILRKTFWSLQLHWRVLVSILLLFIYIPITNSGMHSIVQNIFAYYGKISPILEVSYYAHTYAIETLKGLSNDEDISKYESFTHYIARILEDQADEYMKANRTDLQIEALSLSLRFEYDYNTLYKRYNAYYYSTTDYAKTMKDLDALLMFEESEDDRNLLIDEKSIISQNYGYYDVALENAQALYIEYPTVETDAWVGACLIGFGKPQEAIHIINLCIERESDLPYWVYRMRGIAYLTLVENGEEYYLDNAKSDILTAYHGEKSSKNILAYARLCLFLGDDSQAKELIEDALRIDKEDGRAYYWLSRYYHIIHDEENELIALSKSRELNYIGNGEY